MIDNEIAVCNSDTLLYDCDACDNDLCNVHDNKVTYIREKHNQIPSAVVTMYENNLEFENMLHHNSEANGRFIIINMTHKFFYSHPCS